VLGLPVCRGYVAKVLQKVSQAVTQPVNELVEALPWQRWLNVDEDRPQRPRPRVLDLVLSGQAICRVQDCGAAQFGVLLEVLGRVIQPACWVAISSSAYRKYMASVLAWCSFAWRI